MALTRTGASSTGSVCTSAVDRRDRAGRRSVRRWGDRLPDADLPKLRRELKASCDRILEGAGIAQDLFRA
jgi:hypothetical protein